MLPYRPLPHRDGLLDDTLARVGKAPCDPLMYAGQGGMGREGRGEENEEEEEQRRSGGSDVVVGGTVERRSVEVK